MANSESNPATLAELLASSRTAAYAPTASAKEISTSSRIFFSLLGITPCLVAQFQCSFLYYSGGKPSVCSKQSRYAFEAPSLQTNRAQNPALLPNSLQSSMF